MKPITPLANALIIALLFIFTSCTSNEKTTSAETITTDSVAANIKMYKEVWDDIINNGNLDRFNDTNFTTDVVMHGNPPTLGIDSARAMYANYTTGFSNIRFSIKDVFAQDNKLVKHWNFKGKHTGPFFGIPATGKDVDLDGVTLVRMSNGKIAEERDFMDNYDFMTQLGLLKN
jgi:steroid delta-isomerase-like uncharacterized protein